MEAVVVHRKYSDEERARLREEWLHTACNGGILISAFVSPVEKDIRREAEAEGARIILITDRPFGERGKPAKSDFEKCEEGKLLVLVPMDEDFPRDSFRASCLAMNERAGGIFLNGAGAPILRGHRRFLEAVGDYILSSYIGEWKDFNGG